MTGESNNPSSSSERTANPASFVPLSLTFEDFRYDDESKSTAGVRWDEWIRDFEVYVQASGITSVAQKKSLLIHRIGPAARSVYYTKASNDDDYEAVKRKLVDHFKPLTNKDYQIFAFDQMRQREAESMDDFVVRLRQAASLCGFGDSTDKELKRRIIAGCRSKQLRQHILEKGNIELKDILDKARTAEVSSTQASAIESAIKKESSFKAEPIAAVKRAGWRSNAKEGTREVEDSRRRDSKLKKERKCFTCGREFPHKNGECPAKKQKCNSCGKVGHFAGTRTCKQQVNAIDKAANFALDDSTSSSNTGYFFAVGRAIEQRPREVVSIGGIGIRMLIDSGAWDNLIDQVAYERLKSKVTLRECHSMLHAYESDKPLRFIGQFDAEATCNERTIRATFKVTTGRAGCLLSHRASRQLGLFQKKAFEPVDGDDDQADHGEDVCAVDDRYTQLMSEYSDVFNNKVGRMKNYKVKLHIDSSVKPCQQAYRRLPYHLVKATDKELDKLIKEDIIEFIDGATPSWVSLMVVVPKPKKPGEVRITIDMRMANKAIRKTKFAAPTLEEIAYDLQGSTVFSEVDLNKAFHQLELMDEESKNITAFETHRGIARFKTLNMGTVNAMEELQLGIKRMVTSGLIGVRGIADNLIVFGKDQEEHDSRLRALCERMRATGLTASADNCKLGKKELHFFGLKVSTNGIAIGDDKAAALLHAGQPATPSELRSFLGLAVYCGGRIPGLATLADPLWTLTKEGASFDWQDVHTKAMQAIKDAFRREAFAFFNKEWRTEVTVDASPVGLGAVLAQINPADPKDRRVITCASRRLTDVERNYSQVEKEALAVVFACEKFYLYIFGHRFTLITDNRAVELIYKNPKSEPPLRIKRWALRLMKFSFDIIHKAGAFNIADYLSRHPVGEPDYEQCEEDQAFIAFITDNSVPKTMTVDEVIKATKKDERLTALRSIIQGQAAASKELDESVRAEFARVIEELTVAESGIVLRGSRIVLPASLQERALAIAHEGHQGSTKTKQLLRTKVWFSGIDRMTEELMARCALCQLNEEVDTAQPLQPSEMPSRPWQKLACDFYGPLPNGHELLVVVDRHSRMPVVIEVSSTSADNVVPKLEELFSFVGIPEELASDNGPPFNGHKFAAFANSFGFRHRRVTPEHPQANGQAESFMRSLNKVMRNAAKQGSSWRAELNAFLRSYRSTPHSATGIAPAALLFGACRTHRLPSIFDEKGEVVHIRRLAQSNDSVYKEKMKLYVDKKRRAKKHNFVVGEQVMIRQKRARKTQTRYSDEPLVISQVKSSMITATRDDGSTVTRDASRFKRRTFGDTSFPSETGLAENPSSEQQQQQPQQSEQQQQPQQQPQQQQQQPQQPREGRVTHSGRTSRAPDRFVAGPARRGRR